MTYAYTAYSLFDGTPLVRISVTSSLAGDTVREHNVAEYKLDWTQWQTPVEVNVGPELWVAVRPWELSSRTRTHSPRTGVQGWGRVSAHRNHEMVDMQHEEVVRGLRALEEVEALSWLVRAVEGPDA